MKANDYLSNRLVFDPSAAAGLRNRLREDPKAGGQQAARQFEGMLLQMMLKSMREATPADGMTNSDESRFFTAIVDQQLALDLATQAPTGLAAMLAQQMARSARVNGSAGGAGSLDAVQQSLFAAQAATSTSRAPVISEARQRSGQVAATSATASSTGGAGTSSGRARDFVNRVWPHAVEAAAATGIPARFLVAQAALESGWGKNEIRASDGSPSYNLFGIKAGQRWTGATTEVQTTEYVDGAARSTRARFRAYESYAEAFRDYAEVLRSRPRFAAVIGQQDGVQFARSLQQAGYATDPQYADKLARIIGGATLREALAA